MVYVATARHEGPYCPDEFSGSVRSFDLHNKYIPYIKKNGKESNHFLICVWSYYSAVVECELCGVIGPKKKVMHHPDIFGWNFDHPKDYSTEIKCTLCMPCYNKIKDVVKKQKACDKSAKLLKELQWLIRSKQQDS